MKQYEVKTLKLSNGETIAYREAGSGDKVLVLVHGNMSSSVHFQVAIEKFETDYKIYAFDLRGFGDSSYVNELNSLRDFALDIEECVKLLDLKRFSILGWSTGGGIVLELAADMPESVEKVILLDSVGLKGYPIYKKDEKGQPILTTLLNTKEEIAVDPVQVLPILNAYKNRDKGTLTWIWNALIYNMHQPNPEDYDLYLEAMLKQRNLIDVDYSLANFNFTHEASLVAPGSGRIDLVKAPVVILHGKADMVVPFTDALAMKDFFGDRATLVPFEGVGHSVLTDDLDLFVSTVKAHLG